MSIVKLSFFNLLHSCIYNDEKPLNKVEPFYYSFIFYCLQQKGSAISSSNQGRKMMRTKKFLTELNLYPKVSNKKGATISSSNQGRKMMRATASIDFLWINEGKLSLHHLYFALCLSNHCKILICTLHYISFHICIK